MSLNYCGECPTCAKGRQHYCHDSFGRNFGGTRPDGTVPLKAPEGEMYGNFFGQSSFATHAICHEVNAIKVPADVPLELLGPLACGIQTGAGAVMNSLLVRPGMSFAVFGAGSVGLSAVMAARVCGATTIIAVDLNDARLEVARELGATHTVNPRDGDPVEQIMAIDEGGVDRTLEAIGTAATTRQALDCLALCGACGIVGAATPDVEVPVNLIHHMTGGRTFQGIIEGDAASDLFIPMMIDLYRQGRFPFDRLVTFYDFADINDAVAASESGEAIKPILRMPAA
jgi:aryl-alcohol dehydrogenase